MRSSLLNWQGKGLGTILITYLIDVAKEMEFEKIYATVFTINKGMVEILRLKNITFRKEDEMTIYTELIYRLTLFSVILVEN